jgi:hypothetical protein
VNLRRHWMNLAGTPVCPRCGAAAPDGLVLDASGSSACLACSILKVMGHQELSLRPASRRSRGLAPLGSGLSR